jgi:DNA uptake protein ComE-like DNA-binding protein
LGAAVAAFAIAVGAAVAATPAPPPPPAPTAPVHVKLDINRASKASIARLRGVGEDNAQKIIAGRPYKSADELLSRKILPKDVYDSIAPLIIAH